MKKHIARAMLVVAFSAMIAAPAGADNCNGAITDIGGVAYVDDRDITDGGIWVYEESNGVAGLQSGGTSPLGDADPCQHENPDTLLF